MKALVLSAGGLWAAWEIGAWKVLSKTFQPDLIVGPSAGAWNGWAIAAGCTAEELAELWLDPATARIMCFGTALHRLSARRAACTPKPANCSSASSPAFRSP